MYIETVPNRNSPPTILLRESYREGGKIRVLAALSTARRIGLDDLLGAAGDRARDLVLALIVGRILDPLSKLAAARQEQEIASEAARDGLYIIRTNLPDEACGDAATVRIYKSLARVEHAFRGPRIKSGDRSPCPPGLSLAGRPGARACLSLHAFLLSRVACAPAPGANAL